MTEATIPTGQPDTAPAATQNAAPAGTAPTTDSTQPPAAAPAPAPAATSAPAEYGEFQVPAGVELPPGALDAVKETAKALGLSQEQAQKLVDLDVKHVQSYTEGLANARTKWEADARADPEYGGDKFDENLALAVKARDAFGSDKLRGLLESSGLGNHPEVLRLFVKVGKAISEDRLVTGGAGNALPAGDARRIYAASGMNP